MSLKVEKLSDDTLRFGSDDESAENVAVEDAFEGMGFPQLHQLWSDAEVGDDGWLWVTVPHEHWPDLREAMDGVDVPDADEIQQEIHTLIREREEATA